MAKRRRGDGSRRADHEERPQSNPEWIPEPEQRLYLVIDDDPIGYNIRQIRLSPPTTRQRRKASAFGKVPIQRLPLPNPIICLQGQRGLPLTFAAIGSRIAMTQCLNPLSSDLVITIYNVRRHAVTFGPGKSAYHRPIYITLGNKLLALDNLSLSQLTFKPHQPLPIVSLQRRDVAPWSWHELPPPPFHHMCDVNSYALHPDGQTILVSTDCYPGDPYAEEGMFTFDTSKCEWNTRGNWTLPFTGRAYFVRCLESFVGLSKDPATSGHLVSCNCEVVTCSAATWKLGKEKLFSDDPSETHVSARLVHTGRGDGNEFCLVQCVSVKPGNGTADDKKNLEEPQPSCCYRYRLTTFSLSYDDNGDLTTGMTSWVQCYEVPTETTESFILRGDPVAFWL